MKAQMQLVAHKSTCSVDLQKADTVKQIFEVFKFDYIIKARCCFKLDRDLVIMFGN